MIRSVAVAQICWTVAPGIDHGACREMIHRIKEMQL